MRPIQFEINPNSVIGKTPGVVAVGNPVYRWNPVLKRYVLDFDCKKNTASATESK